MKRVFCVKCGRNTDDHMYRFEAKETELIIRVECRRCRNHLASYTTPRDDVTK